MVDYAEAHMMADEAARHICYTLKASDSYYWKVYDAVLTDVLARQRSNDMNLWLKEVHEELATLREEIRGIQ